MTEREKDVLQFIIEFKKTNGYSPTIKEIAHGINTSSECHIRSMLLDLEEKGYITFKKKSPRTINVLKFIS